ncbi:MBL fold metallo-hydrolase [Paenibacillus glycanilyticus]|uniref:MBL fold metallo-hydrolase n=1 Tax=Paenibacillus glycanilyticus TaxID=126569 RepID=UPI00203FD4F2|nr:MBL fold metallo-hydrolase [Paenibacillus glycanilyticus]MCM3629671.1 MBL fold metallo-hydrolase [Paenibacillus glycanilyticus]
MTILIWIAVLAVIVLLVALFLKISPVFGGKPGEQTLARMKKSPHYEKGKFVNTLPSSMSMSLRENLELLMEFARGNKGAKPAKALAVEPISPQSLRENARQAGGKAKITWFGHSALLLELDGKKLLLDPMLGRAPSPVPWIGGKRFSSALPIEIEELPAIDAVLLSHDHYDHLDYGSIKRLKDKVGRFFVPLGVAAHLERWGVAPDRIEEFNWWEEVVWEGIRMACTPARHFSGRGMTGRNGTLWCSWVLHGKAARIFFSGDSGYGPHFRQIGEQYGPFDLTLMECGQYDPRWAAIHMMPEESVQAHLDVKGELMIPIHWGAFRLAMHDWSDPVERAVKKARELRAKIATPRIGEPVRIGTETYPTAEWWRLS